MEKYILTENTKVIDGITLHQIKAVRSFADVDEGELGGWVESERNLSHEGESWVSGDAMVYGDAQVLENAIVASDAKVYGSAKIHGSAEIFGSAEVFGSAHIQSEAQVYDSAKVSGRAIVGGYSKIYDFAQISGKAIVSSSSIFGNARVEREVSVQFARIGGHGYIVDRDHVLSISNIWSLHDSLTAYVTEQKQLEITYKFFCGSPEEFEDYIQTDIIERSHRENLKSAMEFIRVWHNNLYFRESAFTKAVD